MTTVTGTLHEGGPGSSVDIATKGWTVRDRISLGDEIFRPSRPALGPTQPPVKWVPGLSRGVKCGRSVLLTTHHLLVPRSWKSRAIPLPTLWATPGLQRDHFTFHLLKMWLRGPQSRSGRFREEKNLLLLP